MTYKIQYQMKFGTRGHFEKTVTRYLIERKKSWLLKDGNEADIREFDDLASAMAWIDEERRGE